MVKTQIVAYADDGLTAEIVVGQATVLMGMARARLKLDAQKTPEANADRHLLRVYLYPDLIAATVGGELRLAEGAALAPAALDFETFLQLPDALAAKWEQAVYALNPAWLPAPPAEDRAEEKKEPPTSTAG